MPAVQIPNSLLRQVAKPARYTGGEWNSVYKALPEDPGQLTRFAFCFPDIYDIGMSNQALRIFYSLLNERPDTWCERVFAPWKDMEARMRERGLPLFSLESKTPLADFDLVGFTIQHELCYTNVLNMLDLGGVPLLASTRGKEHPLVIAGGPAAYNLEPMASFFDLVVIGEGEEVIGELIDRYRSSKIAGSFDKEAFLRQAARIAGVYVPAFYDAAYHLDGTVRSVTPNRPGVPPLVRKRIIRDLAGARWPYDDLVPNMEIVHDRVALELFRGCPRGCRFCQAGMTGRPVREKPVSQLLEEARRAEAGSGYDEVGLLSLSTSDYSCLGPLTDQLLAGFEPRHTSLSLPSLRLDSFTASLMTKAARTRKGGLTFAPEAGTQRLRDVINKSISEDDLLAAMRLAFQGGWSGAKLYFMLGLPTETSDDVAGIAELVRSIIRLYSQLPREARPRRLDLAVSTAMFIPKPGTPFQWSGQPSQAILQERQQQLRRLLDHRSVKYQWHDLPMSRLEAVLARGDRRLGPVILDAWQQGRTFDAWDESFDWKTWQESLERAGLDADFYASRERASDEVFPWEHIDCGVSRDFLLEEYRKALAGETTPECRIACSQCGAADFDCGLCVETAGSQALPQPEIAKTAPLPPDALPLENVSPPTPDTAPPPSDTTPPARQAGPTLRLRFARSGPAIWLAHLDMMRLFERAVRRAGLPVAYSQGFNPRPHLVFALPLGTGLATRDDYVDVQLVRPADPDEALRDLNRCLPEGIEILAAAAIEPASEGLMSQIGAAEYLIEARGICRAAQRLASLPPEQPWTVEKNGKSGPHRLDIRPLLLNQADRGEDSLFIRVRAGSHQNLRPDLYLAALGLYGGLDPSAAADAAITRLQLLVPSASPGSPADSSGWRSPLPHANES